MKRLILFFVVLFHATPSWADSEVILEFPGHRLPTKLKSIQQIPDKCLPEYFLYYQPDLPALEGVDSTQPLDKTIYYNIPEEKVAVDEKALIVASHYIHERHSEDIVKTEKIIASGRTNGFCYNTGPLYANWREPGCKDTIANIWLKTSDSYSCDVHFSGRNVMIKENNGLCYVCIKFFISPDQELAALPGRGCPRRSGYYSDGQTIKLSNKVVYRHSDESEWSLPFDIITVVPEQETKPGTWTEIH